MKVLGIVAEYNPFHNGHLYHLRKSVDVTGATHTMAIMSGSFLQRGEAALINKWARAEMAVRAGVDLVIELPFVYSCRSAEAFALGAVSILDKCGAVDCICFGSESGDLERLGYVSEILSEEPEKYQTILKNHLDKGLSFPAARARALESYMDDGRSDIGNLVYSPNNILALEYLKALKSLGSPIRPFTIRRVAAHYNETVISSRIASATAIRRRIVETGHICRDVRYALPPVSGEILVKEMSLGRGPVTDDAFSSIIVSQIRKWSPHELRRIPEVSEGLEHKILDAAKKKSCVRDMFGLIKSKRYTLTRLKRIFTYILLGTDRELFTRLELTGYPGYVRVLAFNSKGRQILRRMNTVSRIPVISKPARHGIPEDSLTFRMLEADTLATDIYVLGYSNRVYASAGLDYVTSPSYLP